MKAINYSELGKIISKMTPDQLNQKVKVTGEGMGVFISGSMELEEDHIAPTDEGMEPRSAYSDDPEYTDETTVAEKGTIFLMFAHPEEIED